MGFISTLSFLDHFSVPLLINFRSKKRRSSEVGLFLSFVLVGYLVFQFSQSDLFRRQHPIVVRETIETTGESIPINFKPTDLITVHVSDRFNRKYIDPTIFQLSFLLSFVRANPITNQMEPVYAINSPLVPCTIEHVFFDTSLYASLGLNNSLCLTNATFPLKGYLNEITNYWGRADLTFCDNKTSNGTCKPIETIRQFFNNQTYYYAVSFHSVVVDSSNYTTPFQTKMIDMTQMVDIKILKRLNIFFKNVQMITDDGVIFPATTNEQWEFSFESLQQDLITRAADSMQLVVISFWGTNKIDRITRRYEKLPDSLGQLVGMANFLSIIGFLIANSKIEFQTLKTLLNKLYLVPSKKKTGSKKMNIKKNNKEKNLKEISRTKTIFSNKKENDHKEIFNLDIKGSFDSMLPKEDSIAKMQSISKFNKIIKSNESVYSKKISQKVENEQKPITMQENEPITKQENEKFNFKPQKKEEVEDDSFVLEHYSINSEQKIPKTENKNKKIENVDSKFEDESSLKVQKGGGVDQNTKSKKMNKINTFTENLTKFFIKNNNVPDMKNANNIHFTFLDYMAHKTIRKNKNISKLESVYNKEIDIVRILKVLHEVENLKLILLNEDQYILFDSIVKPFIKFDQEDEAESSLLRSSSTLSNRYKKKKDIKSKIQAYENISNKEGIKDEINQRLLGLIDRRIEFSQK